MPLVSCSQRLAKYPGAALVLVGRDQAKLDSLQAGLTSRPQGGVSTLVADVTDSKQVEAAISSAGLGPQVLRLNLTSCFNILRASVKNMMANGGGSVVFCSSAVARHGIPNHEAIAAAKAGILGLALSAAATYAPKKIRVNCVAPGLTRTPLAARITGNPASLKASEAMHALKRVGQCLGVDGGLGSLKPQ
ncbi:uncharacterized protein HaLaN_06031 [Haematococcus lacustris]|uniref:Uncharacterized protein n=1 Tax=Haematococcus lacustris TaxID=44745 RepID=A0A699YKR5_HAELA|nr:uncharacterized protein HaLaN_06031 [Haematococcus lacustris]